MGDGEGTVATIEMDSRGGMVLGDTWIEDKTWQLTGLSLETPLFPKSHMQVLQMDKLRPGDDGQTETWR
jgi:hypothetical protein